MCAYHKHYKDSKQQSTTRQTGERPVIIDEVDVATPVKIEKLVKVFKTHRCALDFDHNFCKASFTEEDQPGGGSPAGGVLLGRDE